MGANRAVTRTPLFLDVDGGLCAMPRKNAAVSGDLERFPSFAPDPYPQHAWVSTAAVAALNELIDERLVEPIWCTTWDAGANFLIPALGLHGGPWRVATVGTRQGDLMFRDIWIKTQAVSPVVTNQEFVMVDDLLGDEDRGPWTPQRRSIHQTFGSTASLLVGTKPDIGLTVADVLRVRTYVQQRAGSIDEP
ncbi:hypothetical protein RCH16_003388 [Cryobacterium sp. MP_M5]|uniref:hypothetical protein n=1 Tax=unclassified Cryobacterium TaxID=2649013 RepID=UPI0018CB2670|nr:MULTISPECIES: hypothetical protein [unclassified Cryobacterium]MBG6059916.1 hypothetical protein [Cryobacterium sp. MP_M3]MEC5178350.1 hypothetical protein [Cryobacterium sp. MP_M5]